MEIRFRCKSCGRSFTLKLGEIPAGGIRGKCGACGAPIRLFADGTLEQSSPEGEAEMARRAPSGATSKVVPPGRMTFECPACGHPHAVDPAKIPEWGAKGPCRKCGAQIVLHRDGQVAMAAAETGRDTGGEEEDRWFIQHDGGEMGPFALRELGELVDSGGLLPGKMVRHGTDGRWASARSFPAIAAFFDAQATVTPADDVTTGDEDHCYAHPEVVPSRQCSQCHRFLCDACLKPLQKGTVGVKPILLCAACGGTTIVLQRREKWTPFYRDMPSVLGAPFKGQALFYFAFLSFLEVLKIPCRFAGLYGMAAIFILTCFQFAFYLHLVREVANGSYDFPEWPDTTNFMDMAVTFLKVLLVSLISLVPLILLFCIGSAGFSAMLHFTGGGAPGEAFHAAALPFVLLLLIMFAFYLVYLPICVAIVALFETVLPGLNPILIFRIIFRIGPPYFIAAALWGSLLIILALLETVLHRTFGLFGVLLAAPFDVYAMLVSAYILGRVCYENEEKIGWY